MNRHLAIALAEILFGWALVGAVPVRLDVAPLVLTIVGGTLVADSARRLLRREPLPDGVY